MLRHSQAHAECFNFCYVWLRTHRPSHSQEIIQVHRMIEGSINKEAIQGVIDKMKLREVVKNRFNLRKTFIYRLVY